MVITRVHKVPAYKTVVQLVILAALTMSACQPSDQPSENQIRGVETAVANVRATLYTPGDAELLGEESFHSSNPENYPGCAVGNIYLAYYSPRSFVELLQEYREALDDMGWKPSPDYSHDNRDVDVFESGSQALAVIASFPLREDVLAVPTINPAQEGTIYYIGLYFYDPYRHKCSE